MNTTHTAEHLPGTLTATGITIKSSFDRKPHTVARLSNPVYVKANMEATAARLTLCWNTLSHLDNDAVTRLGRSLAQQNSDTLRDLLADEGF